LLEVPQAGRKAAEFLGDISYPLYAVHWPLLKIFSFIALKHLHLAPAVVQAGFVAASVGLAWLLLKFYDLPLRKWLNRQAAIAPRNPRAASKVYLSLEPD
jgi:peptidoglycan/LPS O-acetylase OafA/YrhL